MGAGDVCIYYMRQHPQEVVESVERWGKEHPLKTRQSEVLKMFPSASKQGDGILTFCPRAVDTEFLCPRKHSDDYSECDDKTLETPIITIDHVSKHFTNNKIMQSCLVIPITRTIQNISTLILREI